MVWTATMDGNVLMQCCHCLKPFGRREWAASTELLRLQAQRSLVGHAAVCRTPIRQAS